MNIEEMAAVASVNWWKKRLCPVCKSKMGEPCVAMNGRVAGGRPDGVRTPLAVAHAARPDARYRTP